jgi:hypothetical protein
MSMLFKLKLISVISSWEFSHLAVWIQNVKIYLSFYEWINIYSINSIIVIVIRVVPNRLESNKFRESEGISHRSGENLNIHWLSIYSLSYYKPWALRSIFHSFFIPSNISRFILNFMVVRNNYSLCAFSFFPLFYIHWMVFARNSNIRV